MKRRNYLICSIIAMLSIVSYACETEYAICEGCGGTGETSEDGNGPSENVCEDDDIQKCAENLKGKQVCEGGKLEDDAACNYCFNENEDNSGTNSLVCEECTPNSYNSTGTKVCYKGAFREFKSKDLDENDSNSGVVTNSEMSDDAPWEFAYNNSGSLKYYNCHNDRVLNSMQSDSGGGQLVKTESCCKENDYYIKRVGYKYYSVEVCRKVVFKEGTKPGFWAYEYTEELNDSLIGQKSKLPYGFCYNDDIFLAVNSNVVEGKSVFHRYQCGSGRECNDGFNGLCIINGVSIDENKDFKCANSDNNNKVDAVFIYETDNETIATCPAGTELKIKVDNGTWSNVDCDRRKFTLDKVRCAPI